MAGRRQDVLDVREILRRIRLGDGHREVARDLGVSRKTVAKYGRWARDRGLFEGPLPEPGALQALLRAGFVEVPPPVMPFKAEAFRDFIVELRKQKVEIQAILQRLREEKGYVGSYASVHRFVRSLEPRTPEVFVRVETAPGEEAQVDFGYAGRMVDPRDGKAKKANVSAISMRGELNNDQTNES